MTVVIQAARNGSKCYEKRNVTKNDPTSWLWRRQGKSPVLQTTGPPEEHPTSTALPPSSPEHPATTLSTFTLLRLVLEYALPFHPPNHPAAKANAGDVCHDRTQPERKPKKLTPAKVQQLLPTTAHGKGPTAPHTARRSHAPNNNT